MAVLTSTAFQDATDYKVISCTAIDNTTAQTNSPYTSGTLYGVIINSTNSSDNVTLHILDSTDTTLTQMAFKGKASSIKTIQIPTGYVFSELRFWVSKFCVEDDTTSFAGDVDVHLLCG